MVVRFVKTRTFSKYMPCLSQKTYKNEFEQTKAKNEFKPTDTESYKEMKQVANMSSDVSILLH